jgi:hypothetical protein
MCDLAYVNLLREKARQLQAEERRAAAFGSSSPKRFVPWVMPAAALGDAAAASADTLGSAPGKQ